MLQGPPVSAANIFESLDEITPLAEEITPTEDVQHLTNASTPHQIAKALIREITTQLSDAQASLKKSGWEFSSNQFPEGVALERAAQKGLAEVVVVLLDLQKDSTSKGVALIDAVENGHFDVVQILLMRAGKEISVEHKSMALKCAAEYGDFKAAQTLLTQAGSEILFADIGKALITAAQKGHCDVVQTILTQVSTVVLNAYKYISNALTAASENGHVRAAEILLNHVSPELSPQYKVFILKATDRHNLSRIARPPLPSSTAITPTFAAKRKKKPEASTHNTLLPSVSDFAKPTPKTKRIRKSKNSA